MQDSRGIRRIDDFPGSHFPMMGRGFKSRNSFISDIFEKDPFDDPFFTQPFGSMFPSMGEFSEPLQHRQSQRQEQQGSRGVVIEELEDDHEDANGARSRSQEEPIVEHPDEIVSQRDNPVHKGDELKSFTRSFAYSSVTYGGPQGTYYKSSAMRRASGDGLFEEIREEKDSVKGHETNQILRGLGNKGHGVTRKKTGTDNEDFAETLHNLTEDEKKEFDETWKKQAKKYLPGFSKGHGLTLKNNVSDKDGSKVVASSLTQPSKQLAWRWPWAKKA